MLLILSSVFVRTLRAAHLFDLLQSLRLEKDLRICLEDPCSGMRVKLTQRSYGYLIHCH